MLSDGTRLMVFGFALALLTCSALAYAEDVSRLTFAQLVESIRAELELTQKIKSFSGKEVEIYDPLRVYKVRGVFEAGLTRDAVYGISLFRMRQARVEEAVGANSIKVEDATAPTAGK